MPPAGMTQFGLFPDAPAGAGDRPDGWRYRPDFLDAAEEAELLRAIARLELREATYKGYTAKRRVAHFGSAVDFDAFRVHEAPPLPPPFADLRDRAAAWAGTPASALASALVAEYRPGVQLGWHRDAPDFETVVGVSLLETARMRFRPYPPRRPATRAAIAVELAPRSIYTLRGEARWGWQHSVAPTPGLRYSITFRTRRG